MAKSALLKRKIHEAGAPLRKILKKIYLPKQTTELRFGRYDIALQTDTLGLPILLFTGRRDEKGRIKGERFTRNLLMDEEGNILKDQWDCKGKARL